VETELKARGRHDPCVVPRAVPMVEAMVALTLVDHLMLQHAQCNLIDAGDTTSLVQGNMATLYDADAIAAAAAASKAQMSTKDMSDAFSED